MGHFYVTTTVAGPSHAAIVHGLRQLHRKAYLAPTVGTYTVVYDAECNDQDTRVIHQCSALFSQTFACIVFTVLNHDDDRLIYRLYKNGQLLDTYDSNPERLRGHTSPPMGGNAVLLCQTFQSPHVADVEHTLHAPTVNHKHAFFAIERHERLAHLLALPAYSVGIGYTDIVDDNIAEDRDITQFSHV
jgi:hypothetical protein